MRVHVLACVHARACVLAHARVHGRARVRMRVLVRVHARVRVRVHMRSLVHVHAHACVCVCAYVFARARIPPLPTTAGVALGAVAARRHARAESHRWLPLGAYARGGELRRGRCTPSSKGHAVAARDRRD